MVKSSPDDPGFGVSLSSQHSGGTFFSRSHILESKPERVVMGVDGKVAKSVKAMKKLADMGTCPWGKMAAVWLMMAGLLPGAEVRQHREGGSARMAAEKSAEAKVEPAREAGEEAVRKSREGEKSAKILPEQPKAGDRMEVEVAAGVKMAFRYCPPGTFMMGSPAEMEGRCPDETRHEVTLSQGFWLAETEVTQGQWQAVMGNNPSNFKGSGKLPVEQVNWHDVQGFLGKVAAPEGWKFALPTEAQWEYACRAGTVTVYSHGDHLNGKEANCKGGFPYPEGYAEGPDVGKTVEAGSYPANAWGLRDMHGNVSEWCADRYGDYPAGSVTDPCRLTDGRGLYRGGSWGNTAAGCRAAFRVEAERGLRHDSLGFRPALVPAK